MPFVGGGVNLAHINETETRVVSNPFFNFGTIESTTTDWLVNPQAVGGAQFASRSRVTFRAEGRLSLGSSGPLFVALGGISF